MFKHNPNGKGMVYGMALMDTELWPQWNIPS